MTNEQNLLHLLDRTVVVFRGSVQTLEDVLPFLRSGVLKKQRYGIDMLQRTLPLLGEATAVLAEISEQLKAPKEETQEIRSTLFPVNPRGTAQPKMPNTTQSAPPPPPPSKND